jgi:hypothetical protein
MRTLTVPAQSVTNFVCGRAHSNRSSCTQDHPALELVTAASEGVGESALLGGGGDGEKSAAANDAVLDASGDELLVRDGSGLTVDGDGSGEGELGNGGAHCVEYFKFNR